MIPGRGKARLDLLLVILLAAAPLVPALAPGRTLYYRDIGQYYLPNRYLTVSAVHEGRVPVWNPQRNSGQPFVANPNSFVLRPTTLLFLLFPPRLVHVPMTLSIMLLLGSAAAGTWLLLRDGGASRPACFLGASAFALAGGVQSLGQLLNHLEGVAFVPWALWAFRRSLVRGWRPWGIAAGAFFGLVVSAGEPVWIAVTLMAAFALPAPPKVELRAAIRAGAAALLSALALSAAQLVPLLENAARSERGAGLAAEEALRWSLPPQALLQSAIPGFWGDTSRIATGAYWGTWIFESTLPWLLSIHLGAPIVLLAAAGVLGRRDGASWRAALLAAGGVVLALGRHTPIYPLLVHFVPGFANVRFPVKWFGVTTWCVAVLAAAGFDRLAGRRPGPLPKPILAAGLLAGAALVGGVALATGLAPSAAGLVRALFDVPASVGDDVLAGGAVRTIGSGLILAAGGTLLVLLFLAPGSASPPGRVWLAAATCAALLLAADAGLNPSAPRDAVFASSPLLRAMPEAVSGELRFFGLPRPPGFAFRTPSPEYVEATGLPEDSLAWGMRWDVRTLRYATIFPSGVYGAYDRTGDSRLDLLPGSTISQKLKDGMLSLDEMVRILAASSVGFLLSHAVLDHPDLTEVASLDREANVPVKLYRLRAPIPRASLVERAREAKTPSEAVDSLRSGEANPRVEVLLDPRAVPARAAGAASPFGAEPPGSASVARDGGDSLDVSVSAKRPAWLVVTDTYDPSWRATLDGAPVPIERANGMFRAVRVGPGEHAVRFEYRSWSLRIGVLVSALALLLGAALVASPPRKPAA